jgi:hypothetical protein
MLRFTYAYTGIVNNDLQLNYGGQTQVDFFRGTGYYMKELASIDGRRMFAVVVNTNLGVDNDVQNSALDQDLAWVQQLGNNSTVLFVGHHPNSVKTMIPWNYQSVVGGSFAGHVHEYGSTSTQGFTQVPCLTQTATVSHVTRALLVHDK